MHLAIRHVEHGAELRMVPAMMELPSCVVGSQIHSALPQFETLLEAATIFGGFVPLTGFGAHLIGRSSYRIPARALREIIVSGVSEIPWLCFTLPVELVDMLVTIKSIPILIKTASTLRVE